VSREKTASFKRVPHSLNCHNTIYILSPFVTIDYGAGVAGAGAALMEKNRQGYKIRL